MTPLVAKLQGFISSVIEFFCTCCRTAPAAAPTGRQTGGTPEPAALPDDVKRYLDEAQSKPRELCSYIFRELNMPWLSCIEDDLVKLIQKSYDQSLDGPPKAPDKTAEILEVTTGILETVKVSVPFGIGVALGLIKLVLDYMETSVEVKELRQSVLRAAVGLLVQVEQGRDKLPHNSPILYSNYHVTLYKAFSLCCTAMGAFKANRDTLLNIEKELHELSTSYGVSFQQATTALRANAEPVLTTDLVGVDTQRNRLMALLSPDGDTTVVLLCGMGGSGKTELAKAAYVKAGRELFLAGNYGYCMLDMLKGEGEELDRRLHAMLRHLDIKPDETDNLDSLHDVMMKRLSKREKPVLLFIDNVLNASVSKSLLSPAVSRLLPKGSRVLITSRDGKAASDLGLPPGGVVAMNLSLLDNRSSEVLLRTCMENEGGDVVAKLDADLVSKLVEVCGGLPLALTVLGRTSGSYIQEKGLQEALRRIEELANHERTDRVEQGLYQVLMRSFDLCTDSLKMAFLDIIAFYEPYDFEWELVARALQEGTCQEALERLQQLSLVEKHNQDGVSFVGLHDQMKVVGQLLMKKGPGNRTHVVIRDDGSWDDKDGLLGCRSVILTTDGLGKDWLCKSLPGLSYKLRLLRITDTSGVLDRLSLAPAAWRGLRCLHVDSQALERLELPEGINRPTSLQVLDLSGCGALQSLPVGINGLVSLQELRLSGCEALQSLPLGISALTGLQELDLSGCEALQCLPDGIRGLTGLRRVDLSGCKTLQSLPDGISGLTGMRRLHLGGCNSLQTLPDGIIELVSLQGLRLSGCEALQSLPLGISGLISLQELRLSGCKSVQSLPLGISALTGLQRLDLSGCESLQSLPYGISRLTSLQELEFGGCQALQSLPDGIGGLTSLRELDLSGCEALQSLPEGISRLTSLQVLRLSGCVALRSVPVGIIGLTSLQMLRFSGCKALQSLPDGISGLVSLQELRLNGCKSLQSFPDGISQLTSLQVLELRGCKSLQSLPDSISGLTSLQELRLSWCEALQALPDGIRGLTFLQGLELSRCKALQSLPNGISGLVSLQELRLSGCESLQSLPDGISGLTSLQELELGVCKSLQSLPDGIRGLIGSRRLDLSGCEALQSLPDGISGLTSLQVLRLNGWKALHSLPDGIGGLTSLQVLELSRCETLHSLPDGISALVSLQVLDLSGCEAMRSLPDGISGLTSLQELCLSGCKSLQSLPDSIIGLTSLQELFLSGCEALQSLPYGISALTGLQRLDLSGCEALQSLPDGISGWIELSSLV